MADEILSQNQIEKQKMNMSVLPILFISFVSTIHCSPHPCIRNELQNVDPTPFYLLQEELSEAKKHHTQILVRTFRKLDRIILLFKI